MDELIRFLERNQFLFYDLADEDERWYRILNRLVEKYQADSREDVHLEAMFIAGWVLGQGYMPESELFEELSPIMVKLYEME